MGAVRRMQYDLVLAGRGATVAAEGQGCSMSTDNRGWLARCWRETLEEIKRWPAWMRTPEVPAGR